MYKKQGLGGQFDRFENHVFAIFPFLPISGSKIFLIKLNVAKRGPEAKDKFAKKVMQKGSSVAKRGTTSVNGSDVQCWERRLKKIFGETECKRINQWPNWLKILTRKNEKQTSEKINGMRCRNRPQLIIQKDFPWHQEL